MKYYSELGQPKLLKDMEDQMVKIKQNLKETQDRHKCYADKNMKAREFKVGENVFLRVKPKKISLKLGSCTKLAARFYDGYSHSQEDDYNEALKAFLQ
jgi:hypothetical protein